MSETVRCDAHGDALPAAFLCRHLLDGTGSGWHDAESDALCPDAWCDACDERFIAHAGWEGSGVEIRVLCACCYHRIRGRQLERVWTWDDLVREAVDAMRARNDVELGSVRHAFWRYDSPPMVLEFHEGGRALARWRAHPVGSFSEATSTFLWSWANHGTDVVDRAPVAMVAGVGIRSGLPELTEAHAGCELVDAWERAAVAAFLLGARALYRCPSDALHVFLALVDEESVRDGPISP